MRVKVTSFSTLVLAGAVCSSASLGALLPSTVKAATISSIALNTESSVSSNTVVNSITYQGFSRSINSFVSGGNTWAPVNSVIDTNLTFQRSNAAPTTADRNKQVVWERCNTTTNCNNNVMRGTAPTTTQAALTQNNIYLGTDNLFANTGNSAGNQSDVERVDFVFASGYSATSDVGVTVFERGGSTGHDGFAIAAITGFDASNNPIYSNLKGYAAGWGTIDLIAAGGLTNTRIFNNGSGQFSLTGSLSQNIGGELILLTDLVSANTAVYGYSLFAYDTFAAFSSNTCTLAQLSSISSTSCYNYSTNDTGGGANVNGGGLDLLAANLGATARAGTTPQSVGAFQAVATPEPLSVIGTILGGIAAFRMRKKTEK